MKYYHIGKSPLSLRCDTTRHLVILQPIRFLTSTPMAIVTANTICRVNAAIFNTHMELAEMKKAFEQKFEGMKKAYKELQFETADKSNSENTVGSTAAIISGNIAAHNGDLLTDATWMVRGDITDTAMFSRLYGISHQCAQHYLSMYPPATEIIIVYEKF
ncbi:hypothetical protein L873DRAFT_1811503 [Choiromyces venosus 120613-1]|uniref:Uncharacterized protein n=1 Tax=Choiromyces venosus 120613-1 TaxID=1336337 RepID=A0A3N4JDK3_9PEZI|nr:hypothetical protein L873DRAFT_1811503 [Choiromyces venosus 120613-1]